MLGTFGSNHFKIDIMLSPVNSRIKLDSEERRVTVDLSLHGGATVSDDIATDW